MISKEFSVLLQMVLHIYVKMESDNTEWGRIMGMIGKLIHDWQTRRENSIFSVLVKKLQISHLFGKPIRLFTLRHFDPERNCLFSGAACVSDGWDEWSPTTFAIYASPFPVFPSFFSHFFFLSPSPSGLSSEVINLLCLILLRSPLSLFKTSIISRDFLTVSQQHLQKIPNTL